MSQCLVYGSKLDVHEYDIWMDLSLYYCYLEALNFRSILLYLNMQSYNRRRGVINRQLLPT